MPNFHQNGLFLVHPQKNSSFLKPEVIFFLQTRDEIFEDFLRASFDTNLKSNVEVDEKFYKEGLEATVLNIMKCAKVRSKQDLLTLAGWM